MTARLDPVLALVVAGAIGLASTFGRSALAEDADAAVAAAREHFDRGATLYEQENWDGALAEFRQAHEVLAGHPLQPLAVYNMARCHEHLFQYGEAMTLYRRYLEQAGPDAEDRAEVEARVEVLDGLLATVRLEVDVPDYEVWVDDRRIGTGLTEIMVPGGNHVVEVRAAGYVPAQQEVQVPARDERTLTFVLERLAEEYHGVHRAYFWSFTATALATLTAGIVMGVLALNEHGHVSAQAGDPIEGLLLNDGDLEPIEQYALAADILYGTAGLFAVTALVLAFLTDWGGGEDDPSGGGDGAATSRVRIAPSAGVAGLGLWGAF